MELKLGEIQVTGIQRREKDGKVSFTLYGFTPFEEWEHGIGIKTVIEWTNRCDLSQVQAGDIIRPIFSRGFQGKAVLADVQIISKSK